MWDVGDKGERHSLISFVRRLPALPARGRKAPWTKSSIFHRLSPATQVSFPRFQALGAFAKETFIHLLSAASIISGIALTGTWCAPGIREGGGAGPVAWRKRGWKFSSEARARFAAPPHRQRPPRGPRRSGKTTGGALARRHTFTLRGTNPAPRFPTASKARRESGRGDGEACLLPYQGLRRRGAPMQSDHPATGKAR